MILIKHLTTILIYCLLLNVLYLACIVIQIHNVQPAIMMSVSQQTNIICHPLNNAYNPVGLGIIKMSQLDNVSNAQVIVIFVTLA